MLDYFKDRLFQIFTGAYSLSARIQALTSFLHFPFILICLLYTIFSSDKENNSPQINKLRIFYFTPRLSSYFIDHPGQTTEVYCFQNLLTAVTSFPETFPLPSVIFLQVSVNHLFIFGESKSSHDNTFRRGLLTDYFILRNFSIFNQSHQNFSFILQLLN